MDLYYGHIILLYSYFQIPSNKLFVKKPITVNLQDICLHHLLHFDMYWSW